MAYDLPSTYGAFNSLPIELNKHIAHYLASDRDIATYRLICRSTNDAIDADNSSFWRARFRQKFATKEGLSNAQLKATYQHRQKQLNLGTRYEFFRGHRRREMDVIVVLRDLIIESFQDTAQSGDDSRFRCRNQQVLKDFVLNSKMLMNDRRAKAPGRGEPASVHPMLAAVKLMCSHFLFELEDAKHNVFAVDQSQRAVYLSTNAAPIFRAPTFTEVNMEWILHCLHFFRHHMMNEEALTLYATMFDLSPTQRPSAWRVPLQPGSQPLGKNWKGTYSYLHSPEMKRLRNLSEEDVGDEYFCDKNVDEGKIQSLQLDFSEDGSLPWPKLFEDKLYSLRSVETPTRAQSRNKPKETTNDQLQKNIQFVGTGIDLDDDFNAVGWLNSLPDQQGIPGWQRITFMKHFMDDYAQVERDNLWAYEGVVLPGGRIILGRWWFASEEVNFDMDYNGPFILWATDEPELEDEGDDEE